MEQVRQVGQMEQMGQMGQVRQMGQVGQVRQMGHMGQVGQVLYEEEIDLKRRIFMKKKGWLKRDEF